MKIKSIINIGFEAITIDIECSQSNGLPSITIVGLASKAVDESKERIRTAISNCGLTFPKKKILVNLAPADIPKDSVSLDLGIAVAILQANKQINSQLNNIILIGELGLDGAIRPVRGLIGKLLSEDCKRADAIFLPIANADQAALVKTANLVAVSSLTELLQILSGQKPLKTIEATHTGSDYPITSSETDFSEIFGQESAKRALLIAAAGGHNVLMSGPPGTGKSMLAKAFNSILPDLTTQQALEVTHLHSLISNDFDKIITRPPLRSPHHTSSDIAIIGGGHNLRPGEISMAHNGVLFLDELPEFSRRAIESLRQPLEDGVISVSRAQQSITFPSNFILIATSNPCPCGYLFSESNCSCTPNQIQIYNKKISGPIMDRIDMHVTVGSVEHKNLLKTASDKTNHKLKESIDLARQIQYLRQKGVLNNRLGNKDLKQKAKIGPEAENLLNEAAGRLKLSPRSYIRTVKVALTIADLDNQPEISPQHIAEALQYRPRLFQL